MRLSWQESFPILAGLPIFRNGLLAKPHAPKCRSWMESLPLIVISKLRRVYLSSPRILCRMLLPHDPQKKTARPQRCAHLSRITVRTERSSVLDHYSKRYEKKGIEMLKKILLAGSAATLLGGLALGTGLVSYMRCATDWASQTAKDSVPLEWEVKRARQMISDLAPEITDNAKRIAREKIAVVRLQEQVEQTAERLSDAQHDIERLSADLRNGDDAYTYGGKTYTSTQVREDLQARFKRFKTRQQTADKLEQQLAARNATLRAANERMDAMLSAKRQLEVEVENLQARLAGLRVAQTSSELSLDDSQLSRTRELLDDIKSRIDVEEEVMQVDVEYFGEIDLDEPADGDLLEEITAYFDGSPDRGAERLVTVDLDES